MTIPLFNSPIKSSWKSILRTNFNRVDAFTKYLELSEEQCQKVLSVPSFHLQVPLRLAKKMAKGSLEDPLVKQYLPLKQEKEIHPFFTSDPVCDSDFRCHGKLLRKYQGRVLLLCTSACAMHCRYCFRQNFDYDCAKGFENEKKEIQEDTSIREVILSGGDPLSLSDEILGDLLKDLGNISHVKRIRFHTKFPIGIPERLDDSFLSLIAEVPQQVYFVIHCNHPNELDGEIFDSLKKLRQLGCVVLNQAVLLQGVNDNVATLVSLAQQLGDEGIIFYYLHQLDRVQGSAQFEVEEEKGRWLIREMSKQLSGYVVPKYVREIADEPNKTPL